MKIKIIFVIFLAYVNFAQAKELNIIVSVPYLKDLIQNVTCSSEFYTVDSLIRAGIDPHTFILSPADRIRIKNADFIIQIGSNVEPWLDKIKFTAKQKRIILTNQVYDPHIWQSPQLTEEAANTLAKTLLKINPQDKNHLTNCTKIYIQKIHSTVEQLRKKIETIPKSKRIIVTNHDSLGYFAKTFGFKIYSILGLSDEEEPSISQLKNLITIVQQQHIKSIFLESTGNIKNIQTVAKNAHVAIGGKLYGDSLGENGSGADTTLGMWQTNAATLLEALK